MAFAATRASFVNGMTLNDAQKFAQTLHVHGYGTTNRNYVTELTGVIKSVTSRIDCK
jgi:hypothetical protein